MNWKQVFVVCAAGLALTGCGVARGVRFADEGPWKVDVANECVSNADSSYVFPLVGRCDSTILVLCEEADLQGYRHLDTYLGRIAEKAGLGEAEILVYVPEHNTLWVRLPEGFEYTRPKSITINLYEESPYTMWVRADEADDWQRRRTEMYTYTYFDKQAEWLCIVDMFHYADTPIARISILQTETRQFNTIGLPDDCSFPFATTDLESIEMLANWVDGHRDISIHNYKTGQYVKTRGGK